VASGGTGFDAATVQGHPNAVLITKSDGSGYDFADAPTSGSTKCLIADSSASFAITFGSCGGGSGGADTDLGNLAVVTAINHSLLPATDNGVDVGSTTKHFNNGYFATLFGNGANVTNVNAAQLNGHADSYFLNTGSTIGVSQGGTGLTAVPTTGQLLIGNGSGYTLHTLTAGTGVSIDDTTTPGQITISAVNAGSCSTCANQALSNLSTTTAINQNLLPGTTGSIDLGSSAKTFKDAFLSGALTVGGGASISGAAVNINKDSNFDTNINTGTSTGAVNIGSSNAGAVSITSGGSTGLSLTAGSGVITLGSGTLQNTSTSLTLDVKNASNSTLTVTNSGTGVASLSVEGGITVGSGSQFTNNSSTLNTAMAISNKATGGAIGTAAATVDVATTFNVSQTTAGQTLSLPSPTSTTAGRIVYVNNVGSANFVMGGITISSSNGSQGYIWNGSAWTAINAATAGTAITLQDAYDASVAAAGNSSPVGILTNSTNGNGFFIQAASGKDVPNLFAVKNAGGVTLLGVDSSAGTIYSTVADGATASGFTFNTTNTYANSSAKLLTVQNGGTTVLAINKDGGVESNGLSARTGGTLVIGNYNANGYTQFQSSTYQFQSIQNSYTAFAQFNGSDGSVLFKSPSSSNSSAAFSVQNYSGTSLLGVDTTGTGLVTLGTALQLNVTSSNAISYTTPAGSHVPTAISIPIYNPGLYGQILAMGLPSTADASSRVISLFDARTAAHQPTLTVFSPNESQVFGLSWEGSNTNSYLKTSGSVMVLQANNLNILTATNSSGTGSVAINGGLSVSGSLQVSSGAGLLLAAGDGTVSKLTGPSNQCVVGQGAGVAPAFGSCGSGSSQWTTSGSNIYYTTGAVLIGTTSTLDSSPANFQVSGGVHIKSNSGTNPVLRVKDLSANDILLIQGTNSCCSATNTLKIGNGTTGNSTDVTLYGNLTLGKSGTSLTFADGTSMSTAGGAGAWLNSSGTTYYNNGYNSGGNIFVGTNAALNSSTSNFQVQGGVYVKSNSNTNPVLRVTDMMNYDILKLTGVNCSPNCINTMQIGNGTTGNSTDVTLYGNLTLGKSGTAISVGGSTGATTTCTSGQTLNGITVVGGIVTAGTCTTNGADIAESYKSNDDLQSGELVSVDGSNYPGVKRSSAAADANLMGVVSTQPKEVLGDQDSDGDYPIALAGRVPTKVNGEGGPIHAGDKITSSSVPGVGKKATGAGMVVGTALQDYDGTATGTIQVLVNLSYYDPAAGQALQGSEASFGNLNVSGHTTLADLHVTGDATIDGTLTVTAVTVQTLTVTGHVITSGDTPLAQPSAGAGNGATVSIDGNDTAGTVTVTTGPEGVSAGALADISFKQPYAKAPRINLTPMSASAAGSQYYYESSASGFSLKTNAALAPNTAYTYSYWTAQ
jgi:hypothetical protein